MRQTVAFSALRDATAEDVQLLVDRMNDNVAALPLTLLSCLRELRHNDAGLQVDRLEHSLQTATLAFEDDASEELVVAALFHDIGEVLAPINHAELAAAVLRPYLSENTCWLVGHHDVFQGYHYRHFLNKDRNERDKWQGHPAYQLTIDFCEKYDQPAFDPNRRAMPLEAFEPMVHRVLSRPRADWNSSWQK